jgi:hypothetical protein
MSPRYEKRELLRDVYKRGNGYQNFDLDNPMHQNLKNSVEGVGYLGEISFNLTEDEQLEMDAAEKPKRGRPRIHPEPTYHRPPSQYNLYMADQMRNCPSEMLPKERFQYAISSWNAHK